MLRVPYSEFVDVKSARGTHTHTHIHTQRRFRGHGMGMTRATLKLGLLSSVSFVSRYLQRTKGKGGKGGREGGREGERGGERGRGEGGREKEGGREGEGGKEEGMKATNFHQEAIHRVPMDMRNSITDCLPHFFSLFLSLSQSSFLVEVRCEAFRVLVQESITDCLRHFSAHFYRRRSVCEGGGGGG